jgi:hypothetical protein
MAMYPGRVPKLPDPQDMIGDLRGNQDYRHPDPNADRSGDVYRAQAVQDYMARQGVGRQNPLDQPGTQGPGMKGADDLEAFEQQNNLGSTRDRLANPRRNLMEGMDDGRGSQNDRDEAAEAAQMSDEDLLAQVQKQMVPPATGDMDNDVTDQSNWPDTPEEFTKKFGREPTTDSEVEFYYGAPEDDRGMERDPPTNERDMRSGRI